MSEPAVGPDVAEVGQRLAAAGHDVDERQAREALSVSRESIASRLYRTLTDGLEPMIAFDPRWRR